jgi:hypothetical protein
MNNNDRLFPFIYKLNTRVFFLLVFILELILIFQGLDLSDEGFLSTFYSRIFSNPQSVSYNFMFWLTGIIGGLWVKLFSPLGLLGIRLAGALVNTITVILTYNLLKKYTNPEYLKIGLILVVISLNNDIKVLNYNTLSALFFILAIQFLFSGLQKNNLLNILVSGFIVGLNVFIRTPNILELALVLGIIYYQYLNDSSIYARKIYSLVKQITCFIAGFLIALSLILVAMRQLGHLQIYTDSLKLLFAMGKSKAVPITNPSGYGLSRLIYLFWSNNIQSLKYAIFVTAAILGCLFLTNLPFNKGGFVKLLVKVVVSLLILSLVILIITHWISHFTILFFITGVILLTTALIFTSSSEKNIRVLQFFGVFFLITFPLGSSDGIYTAGRYCLWIALPVSIDYILKIQSLNNLLIVQRDKLEYQKNLFITSTQFRYTKKILISLLFFAGLYQLFFYPFFDRHNRIDMHFALQSSNLKGIYTSKGRADVFNELLNASAQYIRPNDYVLAYDHIALYYYATDKAPYLSNPLPAVYSADMFRTDLYSSVQRNKQLPDLIIQKIGTVGNDSKWPEEIQPGNYSVNELNLERNQILDTFLMKNNYKIAWENKAFKILLPVNK